MIFLTEKRADLKDLITSARETLSDSERITGKWNKDDKVIIIQHSYMYMLICILYNVNISYVT